MIDLDIKIASRRSPYGQKLQHILAMIQLQSRLQIVRVY